MIKKTQERPCKKKNHCTICNKTIIGGAYNFKSHLHLHNAVKPRFECEFCLKAYYRHDMYTRHLNAHTAKRTSRILHVCDYCDRGYIDKRNLITHLRIHDDSMASNLIRFSCNACGADYCEKRILLNHIRRVHFNQIDGKEPLHIRRMVNDSWYEPVVKTDVCVQITKVNNNAISIKKCAQVKNEKQLSDTDAGQKRDMTEKSKALSADNYTLYSRAICDYCNKEMLKKSIQNHIRERHLKIRKFKCEECKRSFCRRYQLMDHVCGKVRRRRKL